MISPQNLAIGAAAVGLAGQEGDLFRKVIGWSLLLLLIMCVLVYLQSTAVLSWMVVVDASRRAGPGAPRTCAARRRAARIVGDEWVYTAEHQLRTYESDGLLQYHAIAGGGGAARQRRGGPGGRARVRARPACRGWPAAPAPGLSGGALPVADGVLIVALAA